MKKSHRGSGYNKTLACLRQRHKPRGLEYSPAVFCITSSQHLRSTQALWLRNYRTCHSDKSATGGVVKYGEISSKKPQNAEFSNYKLC